MVGSSWLQQNISGLNTHYVGIRTLKEVRFPKVRARLSISACCDFKVEHANEKNNYMYKEALPDHVVDFIQN